MANSAGRRGRLAGPLAGFAVLLAVLALVLSYLGRAILEPEPFADRAVATLKSSEVRDDVADHLTDVVIRQVGDLATVRPLVRAVAGAVIGSGAFAGLFHRAALELHASLVSGHGGAIVLTVADAGVLIQGALERFAPAAAHRVGADRLAQLGTLRPGGAALTVIRFARLARGLPGNPETVSDAELAASARTVLDELYAAELRDVQELYGQRAADGRTLSDVAEVARAATFGAVETLMVDIDAMVPGTVDERTGAVRFAQAATGDVHDVTDEIARRAWLSGARVLAIRSSDVPGGGAVAAILRYAL